MSTRTFALNSYTVLAILTGGTLMSVIGCGSNQGASEPEGQGYGTGGNPFGSDGTGGSTPSSGACTTDCAGMTGSGGSTDTGGTSDPGTTFGSGGELDTGGSSGNAGTGGDVGSGGDVGAGGDVGTGGMTNTGGDTATGGTTGTATCCSSGDCLCHGPAPTALTSAKGSFATSSYTASTGTVYYPTDAQPPFAGIALCGGFTNTGPEMAAWGPFYASYGIVTLITTTGGADMPDVRATKLLASIAELKSENTKSGSALFGKMSDRYGTSGYSMGGGGTTIASTQDATLRSSVGLAAWDPTGTNVKVPTLFLCGDSDTTAPCTMAQSAYSAMPATTDRMLMSIPAATHFSWFGPTTAGSGMSGETALAFEKVYLEGDERWKPLLLKGRGSTLTTNIK